MRSLKEPIHVLLGKLFPLLQEWQPNTTMLAAGYSGSGDSGGIMSIYLVAKGDTSELELTGDDPFNPCEDLDADALFDLPNESWCGILVDTDSIDEILDRMCDPGYEINDGGGGVIFIDYTTGVITHNKYTTVIETLTDIEVETHTGLKDVFDAYTAVPTPGIRRLSFEDSPVD